MTASLRAKDSARVWGGVKRPPVGRVGRCSGLQPEPFSALSTHSANHSAKGGLKPTLPASPQVGWALGHLRERLL